MERVESYLSKGDYRRALEAADAITESLRRLVALAEVAVAFPRDEVLARMLETLNSIRGRPERAVAYSVIGRALYSLDRDKEAEVYFERALETARSLRSPRVKGEVLAAIARNLVLSERYGDALELFSRSVELLQTARGLSSYATEALIKVARLLERSADEIPNERALDFYGLARDVYSSVFFSLQARHLENKVKLAEEVLKRGKPAVEDLLKTGEVGLAIEMARFLPLEERAVLMLELSYWFHLHEQPKLGRRVFDDALEIILVGKFKPRDGEIAGIARRFLRIGVLEEPLTLAGVISNGRLASEILGEVALAYARRGDIGKARSITEGIRDESVKNRVLEMLEGESHVGHEQGLPLISGGEERGAFPEDGGAREVQGQVEQEEGAATRKGDDSRDTGDALQLRRPEGAG